MSKSATYREIMAKWSKVVGKKLVGDEGIKHMSGKKDIGIRCLEMMISRSVLCSDGSTLEILDITVETRIFFSQRMWVWRDR